MRGVKILGKFISIHAPSRERRYIQRRADMDGQYFNPRSLTGATMVIQDWHNAVIISIHAPSRERRMGRCGDDTSL